MKTNRERHIRELQQKFELICIVGNAIMLLCL